MSINESITVRTAGEAAELRGPRLRSRAASGSLVGNLALGGVAALSTLIAISAAGTDVLLPETLRPIPKAYLSIAGPFAHVSQSGSHTVVGGLGGLHLGNWTVIAALAALFGCYVVAVRCADRLSPRAVIGTAIGCTVLMLLAPPIVSTDIFSYQGYARMYTLYHISPYLNGPSVLAGAPGYVDNVYPFIGAKWIYTPSVYGPLFSLLSGLFAGPGNISISGIAASAYAYKLIAAACCLGILPLLWAGCQRRGLDGTRAIALFGLNPLVIVYGVGGGHNDLLTVLLSTTAVYSLLGQRPRSAGGLISMATLIKLTAGLTLPFALAAGGLGARGRRRGLILGAALAAASIMAAGFAVFGAGLLHLPVTLDHVQNMGEGQTLPGFVSTVLRIGWLGHLIGIVQGVIFGVLCIWLLRRVARGQMDWIDGAAWATFGLLVSTSSILPWYVSWLLPLVALATNRRLWTVALCFTGWVLLTTVLAYIPQGQTILGVG